MNAPAAAALRAPIFSAPVDGGRFSVFRSISDLPASTQAHFCAARAKDQRYLRAVEQTLTHEVEHCCFYLEDGFSAPLALQPAFIVRQDLALGTPALLTSLVRVLRKVWPHLLRREC